MTESMNVYKMKLYFYDKYQSGYHTQSLGSDLLNFVKLFLTNAYINKIIYNGHFEG